METELDQMEIDLQQREAELDHMEAEMDQTETELDQMETELDQMETDQVVDQAVDPCAIPIHVDVVQAVMWNLTGLVKLYLSALVRKICTKNTSRPS